MARDMTDKAFFEAIERHGIRHEGEKWCTGEYTIEGYGIPVMGIGRQLDTSSRRALLKHLLQRQTHLRLERKNRAEVLAMVRGDRVERVTLGGELRHGIVLESLERAKANKGLRVITREGLRAEWPYLSCRRPTKRWRGPADLVEALQAERARVVEQLEAIDAQIADATESAERAAS